MTVDEAIDRLTTIDQLPEVGPDLCKEADECLDIIEEHYGVHNYFRKVLNETEKRAVTWNP